jgi:hypothetical protein
MRRGVSIGRARSVMPRSAGLGLLFILLAPASVPANPTPGFHEEFNGTSLGGFGGGAVTSNPGTGGNSGAGDGYLQVSTGPAPANLGTMAATSDYTGDWTAAGVTQIRLWLNDVGNPDPLEIHVALGTGSTNFWQCNTGFIPPNGSWAPFTVDLTNPANFTQIIGTGTFAAALHAVDKVLIRHDRAPYVQSPDPIAADFGIDGILLTNGSVDVIPGPSPPVMVRPVVLAPPAPNPARSDVELRIETSAPEPVHLQVLDALGRIVRHAELDAAAPGWRTWSWDGRDDRGVAQPPGLYRARAFGQGGGMSRPLVRLP